jgi:hypothetical protein
VRVEIQSCADIGLPQQGLYRFDIGFGLGDQVGWRSNLHFARLTRNNRSPLN